MRPIGSPNLVFATVDILSTIRWQVSRRPFSLSGSTVRRNRGASVGSVVKAQIVIEAVAEALHLAVQLVFAGVREGRMPDVVSQRQRFGQALIQSED